MGVLERRGEDYVPTRKAIDVNPVLVALLQWGDAHAAPDGPPRVLVHSRCGHDAHPSLQCAHCEQEIRPGELRVRPGYGCGRAPARRAAAPARELTQKAARKPRAVGTCRRRAPDRLRRSAWRSRPLAAAPAASCAGPIRPGRRLLRPEVARHRLLRRQDRRRRLPRRRVAGRGLSASTCRRPTLAVICCSARRATSSPMAPRCRSTTSSTSRSRVSRTPAERIQAEDAPSASGDWVVEVADGAYRADAGTGRARAHRGRRRGPCSWRRGGHDGRGRALRLRDARRLRAVARGRHQRDRRAEPRGDELRRGARLRRCAHAHDGLRVPRWPRALRAPVAPLRRRRRAGRTAPTTARTGSARSARTRSPTAIRSARYDTRGWPVLKDWPHHDSLTHEQTYYKWVERSWRAGQRLFVNLLVDNEVLCSALSAQAELLQRDGRRAAAGQAVCASCRTTSTLRTAGPGKGWFRIVETPARRRGA